VIWITELRSYKIVLLGDGSVGKTSLIKQFVYSKFDDSYIKTLGTNVYKKQLTIEDENKKTEVKLMVWDVMGQKVFPKVMENYLKGAQGFMLVCDLSKKSSFENLRDWIAKGLKGSENPAGVILANKCDLDDLAFGASTLEPICNALQVPYFFTSAKTGENVEEAFKILGGRIIDGNHINKDLGKDFKEMTADIPDILLAEDGIIHTFCKSMGGYENAMPMVRQQYEQLKIDFERPKWDQLEMLIQRLTTIMRMVKTEGEMRRLQSDMRRYIKVE